jgi:hypothetical protein
MKKIFIFLFLTTLFTSCASFENLTDDRHRPEDDECYWIPGEEFYTTGRPTLFEEYGNRKVIIPPSISHDYSPTYYRPYYVNYPVYYNNQPPTYNPPKPTIQDGQGPVNHSRSGATTPKITHIKRP